MTHKYEVGDFVRYIIKNEVGLVGEVISDSNKIRCYWHMGGTRATASTEIVEPLTLEEVKSTTFSNDYAKQSLMERQMRLFEGGDVSDLIDDQDVRADLK